MAKTAIKGPEGECIRHLGPEVRPGLLDVLGEPMVSKLADLIEQIGEPAPEWLQPGK